MNRQNPLLQNWNLPPLDIIHTSDFAPAIRAAIAEAQQNIESIASSPLPPTFENTIEALETASRRLDRIAAIMSNLNECCTSDQLQETVILLEPEITRFSMKIMTDRRLYNRVLSLSAHNHPTPPLDPEQQTLLDDTLKSFQRHGVALDGPEAERYKKNEEELTELKLRFSQNALADQNEWTLHLTDETDLSGLPQTVRDAAREEARNHNLEGWLFTLDAPSYSPFLSYCNHRHLREKIYRAYASIGGRRNNHDNNNTIRRIVQLRAEQAHLLGYNTYCDYILCNRMVNNLPSLLAFMNQLKQAVLPHARKDLQEIIQTASPDIPPEDFMPWDFPYYAEKCKQQRFDFDSENLRPYFPLDEVRRGIFDLYSRLYGLRFEDAPDVPTYHNEVNVYRVYDGIREMGLLYLDLFPRPSKRSGAWMTEFRGQHGPVRPQIQIVCNFSKPTPQTPSLLRFSEVETFMHEMGHAMHGMLSDVKYESLSGTNVKRDFVEMPSQVMENWCYEPEFLATFARHWQTGEPLPSEYIDKIRASQNFLAAWYCLRQLNLGMTDIAFHTLPMDSGPWKAEDIEDNAMTNLLPRIPGCCTATNFSHIFSGGYASGYYGYKWAEVLDADIFSRFKADGIFNTQTASSFRQQILARGGSQHPATLFRNFMGREPDNNALLKRMNL